MNPSPIRNLVARHVCTCRPLSQTSSSTVTTFRHFSSTTPRNGTTASTPVATYGSAELLSRRYQRPHLSVVEEKAQRGQTMKRMRYSAYGIVACTVAIFATIYAYPDPRLEQKVKQSKATEQAKKNGKIISLDAPPSIPGINVNDPSAPQPLHLENVPTGTSTIPTFPRTIHLSTSTGLSAPPNTELTTTTTPPPTSITPTSTNTEIEYQLIGLGVRTVSFLSIQVYVVGMYIAVPDIATLQEKLIRTIDPVATTLVANEKSKLKELLLDPVKGEEIWNQILSSQESPSSSGSTAGGGGIRTAFRIVPTRNTDVMHMRDGFVRGITAKAQHFVRDLKDERFGDESFGASLNDLKTVFGGTARKKIPTGETLLLLRDENGKLKVVLEDSKADNTRLVMGEVADERVARLLWLNYLAGNAVSSEPARKSVVDGCVEFVGRPVGTVAAQVL